MTDIDRARRFYGEVLGLREVERAPFDFPGAWYELPDGSQVHLIVHDSPLALRGTTTIDSKDGHFALWVESYEATLAHLREHSVACVARRVNKTAWAQIYVTDPDGNVVELTAERE